MNEHITRVSLAEAVKGDRTDWKRLQALSDVDVERACADDEDCFGLESAGSSSQARYMIYRTTGGAYRWRLIDAIGTIIAESGSDFPTKQEARKAMDAARIAFAQARAA